MSDPSNAEEHCQSFISFIQNKNTKLVKKSKIITLQPKELLI